MAQLVARLTGGQEAVSSSLATRTILKKAEIVDIQRFQLFSFSLFLPLGHYLDIILEKTGFFALFQAVLRTKTGHYSEQFSLPGNVLSYFKYLRDLE